MKWYVMHVLTGAELEAQRQLQEMDVEAIVPHETAMIRRGGHWHFERRVLFPGYVFVYLKYTLPMHHRLKHITGGLGLLPKGGKPMPLLPAEVAWLGGICGRLDVVSNVDFSGPQPQAVDGPLKDLEPYIIRYDRHRRKAQLRVPVLGQPKSITLSFVPK